VGEARKTRRKFEMHWYAGAEREPEN